MLAKIGELGRANRSMLLANVLPLRLSVWFDALIRSCRTQVIRSVRLSLVQDDNERFAPLPEWRLTPAANQPTCESSLGLFHPVCFVPVTLY